MLIRVSTKTLILGIDFQSFVYSLIYSEAGSHEPQLTSNSQYGQGHPCILIFLPTPSKR